MHEAAMEWVSRWAPTEPVIGLDIGGRDINGSVQQAFNPASEWEVCDLLDGPLVTWVGSFLDYETTEQYEVVTCTEVAEHTEQWPDIIAHAAKFLEPEGVFIFTAAGPGRGEHSAIDGSWGLHDGEWYENVDPARLADVMEQHFAKFVVDDQGSDVRAVGWK